MKKVKILLFLSIFLSVFVFAGCENREISSAKVFRDDAKVGGSLSFVYDKNDRKIFVGGEGEVVQFSQGNEIFDSGTRVGLKVVAPNEQLDLSSAKLEMNGINYAADEFLERVNGDLQRYFVTYPLVSKQNSNVKFCVTWSEGIKKQCFEMRVVDGTKFMDENGEIN